MFELKIKMADKFEFCITLELSKFVVLVQVLNLFFN